MTKQKWHPEIEISAGLVRSLVEAQFSDLGPIKSVAQVGAGWDNSVFLINKKLIFRMPHRRIAAPLIEKENMLLPNIVGLTSLVTPDLKYIGQPCDEYPFSFHGYEKIDGVSGCHAKLSLDERTASIEPLAHFLKALHGLDTASVMPNGEWPQEFERSKPENLTRQIKAALAAEQKKGVLEFDHSEYEKEFQKALSISLASEASVVLHGDLYCRHLIFRDKKLHGIIDWGDNGVGMRAVDMAVLFTFYPVKCHDKFFEIYGEVSKETYEYARFAAIHSATNLLIFAEDIGDGLLFKEAANAMFRINDKLAKL